MGYIHEREREREGERERGSCESEKGRRKGVADKGGGVDERARSKTSGTEREREREKGRENAGREAGGLIGRKLSARAILRRIRDSPGSYPSVRFRIPRACIGFLLPPPAARDSHSPRTRFTPD